MNTKIIMHLLMVVLVSSSIKSMEKYGYKSFQKIKAENKNMLKNTRIEPEVKGLARTIINDAGLDNVIGRGDFHQSDLVQKRLQCWCRHNPSGCEEMKKLMPYALRYEAIRSIESMQKDVEVRFTNNPL
jgi:hypothetical protein